METTEGLVSRKIDSIHQKFETKMNKVEVLFNYMINKSFKGVEAILARLRDIDEIINVSFALEECRMGNG